MDLHNLMGLTRQFLPAAVAVSSTLARVSDHLLLAQVSMLAQDRKNRDLLYFGSANLRNELLRETINYIPFFPGKLKKYLLLSFPAGLRFDTPARAACAGFWAWYENRPLQAVQAFAEIKSLPYGRTLHDLSRRIATALRVSSLGNIADWEAGVEKTPPSSEPDLRPGTSAAMAKIREVSSYVTLSMEAVTPRDRALTLGRAHAALNQLFQGAQACPSPERALVHEIARRWQEKVSLAGGAVGEEMLREAQDASSV
jgi:hypothetical protein